MRNALSVLLVVALGAAACGGGGGGDTKIDATEAATDARTPTESSCFDGLDDDANGVADCAEPTCSSVAACVTAIPPDWEGYAALYDGPMTGAPSCPATFSTPLAPGNAGLTAPAASCGACTCGAPSGGACAPAGGAANVMPVMWASTAVACDNASMFAIGCTGGDACQPRAPAPFASGLCIHHSGDLACPAGSAFSVKHLFYAGLFDTRGCAPCTCGAPASGACPVGGGAPSGQAMQLQPSTFCCIP